MTLVQFDNGYWFAGALKKFGVELAIPGASKLRKNELETAIRHFLQTGEINAPPRRPATKSSIKDIELGLSLGQSIVHYTSNKITKSFIKDEAERIAPDTKPKSGAWYRLNRWREEQLALGKPITYGDLINQYIALCQPDSTFERLQHGRYINFIADFLRNEPDVTREMAIAE